MLFAVGIYKRALDEAGADFHWPPRRTVTVIAAYAAWVFLIPGSPFNDFDWYSSALGAAVGLGVTAGIALFHLWFGEPEG